MLTVLAKRADYALRCGRPYISNNEAVREWVIFTHDVIRKTRNPGPARDRGNHSFIRTYGRHCLYNEKGEWLLGHCLPKMALS